MLTGSKRERERSMFDEWDEKWGLMMMMERNAERISSWGGCLPINGHQTSFSSRVLITVQVLRLNWVWEVAKVLVLTSHHHHHHLNISTSHSSNTFPGSLQSLNTLLGFFHPVFVGYTFFFQLPQMGSSLLQTLGPANGLHPFNLFLLHSFCIPRYSLWALKVWLSCIPIGYRRPRSCFSSRSSSSS